MAHPGLGRAVPEARRICGSTSLAYAGPLLRLRRLWLSPGVWLGFRVRAAVAVAGAPEGFQGGVVGVVEGVEVALGGGYLGVAEPVHDGLEVGFAGEQS